MGSSRFAIKLRSHNNAVFSYAYKLCCCLLSILTYCAVLSNGFGNANTFLWPTKLHLRQINESTLYLTQYLSFYRANNCLPSIKHDTCYKTHIVFLWELLYILCDKYAFQTTISVFFWIHVACYRTIFCELCLMIAIHNACSMCYNIYIKYYEE